MYYFALSRVGDMSPGRALARAELGRVLLRSRAKQNNKLSLCEF